MTNKPKAIVVDYETADSRGASLQYWRPDFKVLSMSASWVTPSGEVKSIYREGEEQISQVLRKFAGDKIPLVAHNAAFEVGVTMSRFPDVDPEAFQWDTMRMVQCYDSGGKAYAGAKPHYLRTIDDDLAELKGETGGVKPKLHLGLGLVDSVARILPEKYHNHKEPAHAYLRETHGIKKGQEGRNLHLLPSDMLEAYNKADTEVTLALFRFLGNCFKAQGYDAIQLDMRLHMSAIRRIARSQIEGIKVKREILTEYRDKVVGEQAAIVKSFRESVSEVLTPWEEQRREAWINALKSEKGRAKRREVAEESRSEWEFNPRSTAQLTELFVDRMGRKPVFFTKPGKNADKDKFTPKPSFRAAHLPSYGEQGEILQNLKKRQIVGNQIKNLLTLSELDGRWHNGLRACGTKTGRYTGSSAGDAALNIQALARKEEGFMSNLVCDEGYTFVSCDLTAGEPTIACHYSRDENYRAFCFDMVGKKPFYKGSVLYLDDVYLGVASASPTGSAKVKELFHTTWGGVTFSDQWLIDKEVILKDAKSFRQAHKVFTLASMYGSGAKGLVETAYNFGISLDFKDSKAFNLAFWNVLFFRLKLLRDKLVSQVEDRGHLINQFGFRMTPEKPSLGLNYFIQSSVSGAIKCLEELVMLEAPYSKWVTNIHDETIWKVPVDKANDFRVANERAVRSLNQQLNWTVPIRTGFVVGDNLFTAK